MCEFAITQELLFRFWDHVLCRLGKRLSNAMRTNNDAIAYTTGNDTHQTISHRVAFYFTHNFATNLYNFYFCPIENAPKTII